MPRGRPAAVPQVQFALSPGAALHGTIDMTTPEGRKAYYKAIRPLNEDTFYDCQPDGLKGFLDDLGDRAIDWGWNTTTNGIMQIPDNPTARNPNYTSLLTNYGELSLETIRAYEATYITAQNRYAQDTHQLYMCIMNSLSTTAKAKVKIYKKQFTINGHVSGNLLLKVLIRESHLDTNATASQIRIELASLDKYMPTIGSDIGKFNEHVNHLVEGLTARGQITTDLVTNLYKGYAAASDAPFVDYIARKQEEYEEGGTTDNDKHAQELMTFAYNKFKNSKLKGTWNAPNEQEEKIIALEAKVNSLKKQHKKVTFTDRKGNDKDTEKNKKRMSEPKPEWLEKNIKPSADKLKEVRKWRGNNYHYCCKETGGKCQGNWRVHLPSKCKGTARKRDRQDEKDEAERKKKEKEKKKLKLASALSAVTQQEDSSDDE